MIHAPIAAHTYEVISLPLDCASCFGRGSGIVVVAAAASALWQPSVLVLLLLMSNFQWSNLYWFLQDSFLTVATVCLPLLVPPADRVMYSPTLTGSSRMHIFTVTHA